MCFHTSIMFIAHLEHFLEAFDFWKNFEIFEKIFFFEKNIFFSKLYLFQFNIFPFIFIWRDRKFSKLFEFLHYFYKRLHFGGYLGQNLKKRIQKFWNLRFGDWISMSIFSNLLTLFFFLIGQCHSGALKFISHRVINFEYCVMLYKLI